MIRKISQVKHERGKGKTQLSVGSDRTYLSGVDVAVRKRHRGIILVHYFTTQSADDGGIDVVTEWDFFRKSTKPGVADWAVVISHVIVVTGRKLQ